MELLNLSKWKQPRMFVSLRKSKLYTLYTALLEVEKRFIYQEPATNAIYTGLPENMNVF
jgi:hypothetical protein